MTFPVHTAKCTEGPSLPTDKPDAMASGRPMDFMASVRAPRKAFIAKPATITLISEIPEPAAYGAKVLTRTAERKAKRTYGGIGQHAEAHEIGGGGGTARTAKIM